MDHPVGDVAAARALLDTGRMLLGITLRAVAAAPVPLTVQQHRVLVMIAADGPRRVGALARVVAAVVKSTPSPAA